MPSEVEKRPTIVVDGDACPVKAEIADTARAFQVPVLIVSSFDHRIEAEEGVRVVQVDRGDQSADLYIVNHIQPGDIVITQDYGLATIALARRCLVLSFRGMEFHADNIEFLLARRHAQAKARRQGKYGKGQRPLTFEDRKNFQTELVKLLIKMQEFHSE
ncbi:YaiI/YqxD family protein [Paenibacillus campi]|uniref:YaiI/YqxD family protein n=1 Tax=Paenibacillus campi TaxID=3106031 RepID=UPI002AFF8A81|nr:MULTISPECIES: YaiI/YqxD family protein [unclassified Paenibacillus]